ncbi:three prime repair exonuclease 4 [Diretmus argenteus]
MQTAAGAANLHQPLVFFDLETTGLGQSCEIIQLSAVSGDHSLNLFTLPPCPIQRQAARVTGFRIRRHRLYLYHRPILTNSLREVLVSFLAFLRMLGRPLVVGHNIRRFDCPLLARALDRLELRPEFESSVSGCVDTLPLAREMLKGRGFSSFRQENLVKEVLGVNYKAHDALEDVRALQMLYSALRPAPELVCRHTFTLDAVENKTVTKTAATAAGAPCMPRTSCMPPPGQHPLWEHFRQAVKVSEGGTGENHADTC